MQVASRTLLNEICSQMNSLIYKPRKDKCDLCTGHELGTISDSVYNEHNEKKNEAGQEVEYDKEYGKLVFTMDVEAVLICPRPRASSMYYKTKLAVHNFTIYNLKNNEVLCYLFDETEADLSSDVFASMLYDFVCNKISFEYGDEVIFYSDGCTYQNRNKTVANMSVHIAMRNGITITQKFLEKRHTQMECDSCHSASVTRVRSQEVYLPSDYVSSCLMTRREQPYEVKTIFFSKFSDLQYYSSIRPGKTVGDMVVTDVRALKYTPDGSIYFKLRHSASDWSQLTHRKGFSAPKADELSRLFETRRKIKKQKFQHLQEQKKVLSVDTHAFYDTLQFS